MKAHADELQVYEPLDTLKPVADDLWIVDSPIVSLTRMEAWEPERIIVAHGKWYEQHGAAELRRAFRWLR